MGRLAAASLALTVLLGEYFSSNPPGLMPFSMLYDVFFLWSLFLHEVWLVGAAVIGSKY